uniref:Cytochrome b5 heme-binding domain-containing protein n=1 Tax=Equus caballus TaxID=9796 RepID=F7C4G0_HORSE
MKFEEKYEGNGRLVGKSQPYLYEKPQGNWKPVGNEKAEASVKQEANGKCCDTPRKILNTYSWQEIQRHNQESDQWLVINHKVYDVTGWAKRHPGGRWVLNHYAGDDAMDVFRATHPKLDIVQLYLKPLLIGELAPGEPSQERNKNSQLVEDFQELRRKLEAMNMFNANLGFFFLHLAQILILEALAWLMLWHFGNSWTITIFISFLLTVSQVKCVFTHDAEHLSIFKKSKCNRLMHKFDGVSRNLWISAHPQHHGKPNIYSKDPDISFQPLFLFGDLLPVEYGKRKIKYINYEKQHLYFLMIVLPFFMPGYISMQTVRHIYSRKHWEELPWVSSFYIHYFIIFGPSYGIFGSLLLIYFVNHITTREENQDWLSTQVLATCNVEQSFFNDWFTGHLNFQIEHHLFPTMPRHNYHKVAPLVKSLCAKHGLQYVKKPLLKAVGDIFR